MNTINRFHPHSRTADRRNPHRPPLSPPHRTNDQPAQSVPRHPRDGLVAEAVVASYINDISAPHRNNRQPSVPDITDEAAAPIR
jgi:hypothetical protein